MTARTLYLAWQAKTATRAWFPVGRLDIESNHHRFRYIRGAEKAQEATGFHPLIEFPDLYQDYRSGRLFALFRNRVIAPGRPDREQHLRFLDLSQDAGPFEILSVSGGNRVTDPYEVFPRIVKSGDGSFACRFFLHGWRHVSQAAQERLHRLRRGEDLYVTLELTNPVGGAAVQLQTTDYHVIGWSPRYLVEDLVRGVVEVPDYKAHVVRVNSIPSPSTWRVLIEMSGHWTSYEPMSGEVYEPLVK